MVWFEIPFLVATITDGDGLAKIAVFHQPRKTLEKSTGLLKNTPLSAATATDDKVEEV